MSSRPLASRVGATSAEYAFIASLICVAIAAGVSKTGVVVACQWQRATCAVVEDPGSCKSQLVAAYGAQCNDYWPQAGP